MGKKINVLYNDVRLDFYITKEKKIVLLYIGLEDHKKHSVKEDVKKFYPIVEASYLGDDKNLIRGNKHYQTGYAESYKFISFHESDCHIGKDVCIKTANEVLEIETHYVIHKAANAVSTYSICKNISKHQVKLTFLSSFTHLGVLPINKKNTYLYEATSSWHEEAQWNNHALLDLGIFNGNGFTSMKRHILSNTGSWSTKDHLPMMVLEDRRNKKATLIQIENNGEWNLELGDFIGEIYLSSSGPTYNDQLWIKDLDINETFKSVSSTLSFGKNFESVIQEITKARRSLRRDSLDLKDLPVIFNDYMHALWDTQTTDTIVPLVDIASSVGCDTFCIDAGWFAKGSSWWDILGVWEEEKDNFPNGGLSYVINYIKSKGMKAGLWIEIEAIGMNSPILKNIKEGWVFEVDGIKIINNKRYQLDFSNKEVYEYALNVIDKLMNLYKLDYLKIDYNVDAGRGTNYHSSSISDGLLLHNRAYIRWLNEIMDKYPNLTIENCGSGGCRMDYEILKYCPIQSTSDQTNYRKYPFLACNVFTACPMEQAAVWSYPINDYEKVMPSDEVVIMNMVNAILGRIHLASFINKLPSHQLDLIKEGLTYYKSINEFKKVSVPIYPHGTAKFFDKSVVGGIKHDNKIILSVWNTSGKPTSVKVKLARYNPIDVKVSYPLSVNTRFSFNSHSKKLTIKFNEEYGARMFEITCQE